MTEPTATSQWIDVCPLEQLKSGVGKYITCGNRGIAVFRTEDQQIRAVDNACPHAGASLVGGLIEDGCVVCPMHGWAFDLCSGKNPDNPGYRVRVFPTRVVDGLVQVDVAALQA